MAEDLYTPAAEPRQAHEMWSKAVVQRLNRMIENQETMIALLRDMVPPKAPEELTEPAPARKTPARSTTTAKKD